MKMTLAEANREEQEVTLESKRNSASVVRTYLGSDKMLDRVRYCAELATVVTARSNTTDLFQHYKNITRLCRMIAWLKTSLCHLLL